MIHANTPQAKGRIERLFKTLQDRLVKELRLKGISSIKDANNFLPEYLEKYNKKFSVKPKEMTNLHVPLKNEDDLSSIFTKQEQRVLSKNLTCQYQNKIYQVHYKKSDYILRNVKVIVHESKKGDIVLMYRGKSLSYSIIQKQPKAFDTCAKDINPAIDKLKAIRVSHKPAHDHPWRKSINHKKSFQERGVVRQG